MFLFFVIWFQNKKKKCGSFFYNIFSDIDECTVSTAPICSQLCNDKQGTYECECIEGYNKTVVAGATTCKVNGKSQQRTNKYLFVTRYDLIYSS